MDDLYVFCSWFLAVHKNNEIITYFEVSKKEFVNVIDECYIFAKSKSLTLHVRKFRENEWLHMDFLLDDYLIGYAEYNLLDDDDLGVILNE